MQRDILNARVLELLEVMMRAQERILDIAAIRQINWDVHLGDMVTVRGVLQRKHSEAGYSNGWLVDLVSIRVDEPCTTHDAAMEKGSWLLPPCSKVATKYTNMVLLDGFNACKYYFSSKEQCHFWHGHPEDFKANQRRWIQKRLEKRANAANLAGDSGNPHSKIDKTQRSHIFCDWLVESLGEEFLASGTGVIDVAGGKGDILVKLQIKKDIQTTLIDPRPMKLGKYNCKLFAKASAAKGRSINPQLLHRLDGNTLKLLKALFANCSVLVGMHPDEVTEAIVDASLTLRKPFAIVPCCVMSRVFPDRRCWDGTPVVTYETFIKYLREKHPSVHSHFLPFAGCNQVLYVFDYVHDPRGDIAQAASKTIRQKLERYTFLLQCAIDQIVTIRALSMQLIFSFYSWHWL
ncbi:hypothetical protein PsorP6_019282 [Peronosclerospora sorghi]|nr:hypothetical protein PsorP6_019282 [Peronosclerospora sorghi]